MEKILEAIIHLEVKVATVGDEQVRLSFLFSFSFKELFGLVTGVLRVEAAWWLVD